MSQKDPKRPQFPLMRNDQDRNRQQPGQKGGPSQPPERRTPRVPTWLVASLIIVLIGWYIWEFFGPSDNPAVTGVTYSAVTEQIQAKNVEKATLSETTIRVELRDKVKWDSNNERINNDAPANASGITETDSLQATLPQGVE